MAGSRKAQTRNPGAQNGAGHAWQSVNKHQPTRKVSVCSLLAVVSAGAPPACPKAAAEEGAGEGGR